MSKKSSDRHILTQVLSLPLGSLSSSEKSAFQHMFDMIASGRQAKLSFKQRLWVEEIVEKFKLDQGEQPPPKKIEVKDKSLLSGTVAEMLKPPPKPIPPKRKPFVLD